ncbi:hypothetical protein EsH8_VI_000605 [Colletotrichum jinshuiense]
MCARVAGSPDRVRKRQSHEISRDPAGELVPNRSLSDFILYAGGRGDPSDVHCHWTSSTEDKILCDADIDVWLDQQDEKSTNASVIDAINDLELGSVSEGTRSSQPTSPGASSQASSRKRQRREEPRQASDAPDVLCRVGAFADTPPATPGKSQKRTKSKHRPLTGWFNLWL